MVLSLCLQWRMALDTLKLEGVIDKRQSSDQSPYCMQSTWGGGWVSAEAAFSTPAAGAGIPALLAPSTLLPLPCL